ncbi:60S acidic ribosomal protein P1-like isoform X2 [Peromyscus californicus insignis]|uniref:60S acidic ribosomal protein P1-like isoform X2 n=1 Tax=Peromyscus californicus insignis TaxID=564181 RepID=UPI0022A705EE|nr:60S acidic ribosomal protein P1-like isoform X2 [Peromyscus californicus insignis]
MASVSELPCIYSALILHDDEVTALASVNIGSLICNVGAGGPAPAAGAAPVGSRAPSAAAAPAEEKKVEAKKEESEESDDDMGFGLFD